MNARTRVSNARYLGWVLPILALAFSPVQASGEEACKAILDLVAQGEINRPETLSLFLSSDVLPDPSGEAPQGKTWDEPYQDRLAVALPAQGSWRLRVAGEGVWAAEKLLSCAAPAQTLTLYPRALLKGTFEAAPNTSLPTFLVAVFSSSMGEEAGEGVSEETALSGSSSCQLSEEEWSCALPALALNLRLQPADFVPHFFLGLEFGKDQVRDLGTLRLRAGGRLRGWVEVAGEGELKASCTVTAKRVLGARTQGPGNENLEDLLWSVQPNTGGSFSLTGLEPGSYSLEVSQEGYISGRIEPLLLEEGSRIDLPDPLRLQRPLDLEVSVQPPTDLAGKPWQAFLMQGGRPKLENTEAADAAGRLTFTALAPGPYTLLVMDSQFNAVASESLQLASAHTIEVQVEYMVVQGQIRLGDKPLAASLLFSGQAKSLNAQARSSAEGTFEVTLPGSGQWNIDIRAVNPRIFRRLQGISIEVDDRSGRAELSLPLPDSTLRGQTVDGEGNPLPGCVVLLVGLTVREPPSNLTSDSKGGFEFSGIPPGEYRLEAHKIIDDERWTGGRAGVQVEADASPEPSLLTLQPPIRISGSVRSASGPVPGAKISLLPWGDDGPRGMLFSSGATSEAGYFELGVAEEERYLLTVQAPGFGLHKEILRPRFGRQVAVLLHQRVGRLRLELADANAAAGQPSITLNGETHFGVSGLRGWARLNRVGDNQSQTLEVPFMPVGSYEICWPQGAWTEPNAHKMKRCVQGTLAAGAELVLRSPFADS